MNLGGLCGHRLADVHMVLMHKHLDFVGTTGKLTNFCAQESANHTERVSIYCSRLS